MAANILTGNPVFIDTAASSTLTGIRLIQCIQWIATAIPTDLDDLSFTLNGVSITTAVPITGTAGEEAFPCVLYQAGPFPRPISAKDFVVNTIDSGVVLVWLA
jgi:hypothetical protein